MRLIDADALKERLIKERNAISVTKTERYGFGVGMPSPHGMSMRGGINKAFRCMEECPTIEAEPVRHGRWIVRNKANGWVDCSECGTMGSPQWKRCPVCEAKMDGGTDNG